MTEHEAQVAKAKQILTQFAEPQPTVGLDLDALIAKARADNGVVAKVKDLSVEAHDPELVNTLLAQASELKRVEDGAKKERAKITDFLGDLVEAAEIAQGVAPGSFAELTVHGAVVFTNTLSTSRVLNQTHIKSMFPDIKENAEVWSDQTKRTRLYK